MTNWMTWFKKRPKRVALDLVDEKFQFIWICIYFVKVILITIPKQIHSFNAWSTNFQTLVTTNITVYSFKLWMEDVATFVKIQTSTFTHSFLMSVMHATETSTTVIFKEANKLTMLCHLYHQWVSRRYQQHKPLANFKYQL